MFIKSYLLIFNKMSAVFKNSKKKINQSELRKLMNDHKIKVKDVKKIESPLAKYNDQGQLTCVLCNWIVRSESVWPLHINSKKHKENIEVAKKFKERTNNFTKSLKRPLTPPPDVPEKKIKGILKNTKPEAKRDRNDSLPKDFFDSKLKSRKTVDVANNSSNNEEMDTAGVEESTDMLPEGFFDDPKLDAKARNQEYKDPVEEEWERFLKVIKEADNESNAIIAEDQEEATTERQIDEIDEQMKKLSRYLVRIYNSVLKFIGNTNINYLSCKNILLRIFLENGEREYSPQAENLEYN
ncbi:zinc finger protein 830 isoform X1 [Diorhabda carinulata]|uniref:zinc finger protein 830 isoform X1 n=1 Tax=Diorhabda carinulata TaxID=1163345 RepID=UPI0025A089C6|nr:zinc finger protein 830 isoform X1 [Diorhabda carinulata]